MALGVARFEALGNVELAWAGAVGPVYRDGVRLECPGRIELRPGQTLHFEPPERGCRTYLAVRGGWSARTVLGSVSGTAVGAQDALEVGDAPEQTSGGLPATSFALPSHHTLDVLPGPQADRFDLDGFCRQVYRVSVQSNRVGIRLEGPPMAHAFEIRSEPCVVGAVQITREGMPVILGPDGPTIGGYPKIAVVAAEYLDALGQLTPGMRVGFRWKGDSRR